MHLLALNAADPQVVAAAEGAYAVLTEAGYEVLYDDREESAGVKFNDADLLGLPVRVVVSPRNLKQGVVEVKRRRDTEALQVAPSEVASTIAGLLARDEL